MSLYKQVSAYKYKPYRIEKLAADQISFDHVYQNERNHDGPDRDLNPCPLNFQSGALPSELFGAGD